MSIHLEVHDLFIVLLKYLLPKFIIYLLFKYNFAMGCYQPVSIFTKVLSLNYGGILNSPF